MKDERHIRAVIFDLGRVLVDIDVSKGIFALFAERFSDDPKAVMQKLSADELMNRYNAGQISPEQFHKALCDKFGLRITFQRFAQLWCDILSPVPGMGELLREISSRVCLGLLSDTDPLHWNYLVRKYDVLRCIENPTLSYQIGSVKPCAESYLTAAKNVNTPPQACLYIDDLAVNVKGALAVGMDAVQFEGVIKLREELAARGIL
jgi:putative hydrolase of the HAD superfamily